MRVLLSGSTGLDLNPYVSLLARAGLDAVFATEEREALWLLAPGGYRAVVVDLTMGPLLWHVIEAALWSRPPARVIGLVPGPVSTALRRRAYSAGVWEVVELPEDSPRILHAEVVSAVRRAVGGMAAPAVLHIDGCTGINEGVGALMADEGCHVDGAGSCAEAVRRMQGRPYDLIITELRWQGTDEYQVLREAANLQPGVPVIVLTATQDDEAFLRAIELGARACLWKLSEPEEILGEVRALLTMGLQADQRRQG